MDSDQQQIKNLLPLIGRTADVDRDDGAEHWRSVFGGMWGDVDLHAVKDGQITGALNSRRVGDLTFNRIEFGNQKFERTRTHLKRDPEPFYSLTFPESGSADCQIGDARTQLVPHRAYLLNNGLTAKLRVEEEYSTFNVKIPLAALEHRLGRKTDILSRTIIQPDAIYHMMQRLSIELLENVEFMDDSVVHFLTTQMLDTIAFFLASNGDFSNDSIAIQSIRARALAYIDAYYSDPLLTPQRIAELCGISRSYLYKVFADSEPVMERLRNRRLSAAKNLVENNPANLSLTQIAMSCGFSNSSEFSKLFRKKFGLPPSKF